MIPSHNPVIETYTFFRQRVHKERAAAVWHGCTVGGRGGLIEEHKSLLFGAYGTVTGKFLGASLPAPTEGQFHVSSDVECILDSCLGLRGGIHSVLTTFHVSPWFQKDEPSSRLNKVPPIGAPKAAATPAAAPADTKSRLSLRKRREGGERMFVYLRKRLRTEESVSYCFTYEPSPSQLGVS